MKKFKELTEYHYDHGYWTPQNNQNYEYVLCPEPFSLSFKLESELSLVGKVIGAYHDAMENIFDYAESQKTKNDRSASMISRILKQGCDGLPFGRSIGRKIPLTKVDLIIDKNENLKIAEIDSYNPRGIPFALFLRDIYKEYKSPFCNPIFILDSMTKNGNLTWVYSDVERYYERIFKQMQRIVRHDMNLTLINASKADTFYDQENILMIPTRMHKPKELSAKNRLLEMYTKNVLSFAYPMHPWISTKGALGIVSNPTEELALEELLKSSFDKKDLEFLRILLPKTAILGKALENTKSWCNGSKFMLKKNVSSGLKGVWLADANHEKFREAVSQKNPSYIAQEFVDQKTYPISYYDQKGDVKSADWYLRLTTYVDQLGRVVDAEITGRRTPDVHGAPDCIMLPCI